MNRTTTIFHETDRRLKERLMTDVVLLACFAAIVALSVEMFLGLYCWSQHAAIFPSEGMAQPAIMQRAI